MTKSIIYWQGPDTKEKIISELQKDEIFITTTDTIPGFLANITKKAFNELNKIKGDREKKPYIILVSDQTKLENFIDTEQITTEIQKLIKKCWPGPLTIIFKAKKDLPSFLKSEQGSVAIRCPNDRPMLDILQHFDGLFSTSANVSKMAAPEKIETVHSDVTTHVKYLVDDETPKPATQPSTIIDVTTDVVRIVRLGGYSAQELKKVLGDKLVDTE